MYRHADLASVLTDALTGKVYKKGKKFHEFQVNTEQSLISYIFRLTFA